MSNTIAMIAIGGALAYIIISFNQQQQMEMKKFNHMEMQVIGAPLDVPIKEESIVAGRKEIVQKAYELQPPPAVRIEAESPSLAMVLPPPPIYQSPPIVYSPAQPTYEPKPEYISTGMIF